ncbi:MAG TPA: hypothetical protein VF338_11790 [Leptolinea sp.]
MSIVQGIIKGFIGNWGMKVGEFYYNNSLWINGIILLYALVIFVAWKNYRVVSDFLIQNISDQLAPKAKTWSKSEVTRNLKSIEIPWLEARKRLTIPLLAKTDYFIPTIASVETIQKLFPQDVLIKVLQETNKK